MSPAACRTSGSPGHRQPLRANFQLLPVTITAHLLNVQNPNQRWHLLTSQPSWLWGVFLLPLSSLSHSHFHQGTCFLRDPRHLPGQSTHSRASPWPSAWCRGGRHPLTGTYIAPVTPTHLLSCCLQSPGSPGSRKNKHFYTHFTDVETEAQADEKTVLGQQSPGVSAPRATIW